MAKTLVTEQFLCVKSGLLFKFKFKFWRWRHSSSPLSPLPLYVCTGSCVMYVLQPLCDRALTHFHHLAHWHCCLCPEQRDREAEADQQKALCHCRSHTSPWRSSTLLGLFCLLLTIHENVKVTACVCMSIFISLNICSWYHWTYALFQSYFTVSVLGRYCVACSPDAAAITLTLALLLTQRYS